MASKKHMSSILKALRDEKEKEEVETIGRRQL